MSEKTESKLKDLEARLTDALETAARARKGGDKDWKRECNAEVENVRNLISNVIAYREYQNNINVHGR